MIRLASPQSWAAEAACADHPYPDDFFPPNGNAGTDIRALCAGCPVRNDCLNWALHHEAFGYWGGTTEDDRQQIRKRAGIVLTRPEFSTIEPVVQLGPECGRMDAVRLHLERGEPLDAACDQARRYNLRKRLTEKAKRDNARKGTG